VVSLPRLAIAAPATGQGKTTVATGLMAALDRAGYAVSGHKVGPDYIDPGYHALACGRPGRNLDPHLVGEDRIVPLLLHGATGADIAVIEGVMGLFDGRIGGNGFASTAHVAALTRTPVVLVVDISRSSRSVGAVVHGVATYDPGVRIAGVVLNQAGSPRHAREVAESVRLPVLGVIPREDGFRTPSRHLGLVPAAERDVAADGLDRLAERVAEEVDLERVLRAAEEAPELDAPPWAPDKEVTAAGDGRPVVAVAGGRAFTFRYAETEELLRAAGCEVVVFDPLADPALPPRTAGIYLGGGFPEVHATALADNSSLRDDLRQAVAAGVPTVAECAGLLYLCQDVDGAPMVGAVQASAAMSSRLTLRYPEATAAADSLLTRAGERVSGHEFHRTDVVPEAGDLPAWEVQGAVTGFAGPTLHASYLHTHWAGHPSLAQRFADAVHAATAHRGVAQPPSPPVADVATAPADPLRHHGDVETGTGLVDFAVNVFAAPRPPWLDRVLHDSLDQVDRYPTSAPAEGAVAAYHGRAPEEVLATAGAAEAFTLLARLPWHAPTIVHPQFTEPHAALEAAGHDVQVETCAESEDFALAPDRVPERADLVMVGNPTNPTGVLHAAGSIRSLLRPGRVVVVDEAFMDAVPGEPESLAAAHLPGLVVVRSLTKQWSIPGVRAGYAVGDATVIDRLRRLQPPWSLSGSATAALVACSTSQAAEESTRRAATVRHWRRELTHGLDRLGVTHVPSAAPFVLAKVGAGVHGALRSAGIAARRADTFPGLGPEWVRIAVRSPGPTARLLTALEDIHAARCRDELTRHGGPLR
jgi:cobyrinic acid a,c-diamide synthase